MIDYRFHFRKWVFWIDGTLGKNSPRVIYEPDYRRIRCYLKSSDVHKESFVCEIDSLGVSAKSFAKGWLEAVAMFTEVK